jgi:nucleoside-diphosphate-sugar epimerase
VHTSTQFVVRPGVAPPADDYYEPYTVYGAAKAESERLVRSSGLPFAWCIVRPTIIWGPHHPTFADNIWKFIRLGLYLHPSQSPEIMRAFGYVTNAAQQILSVALHGGAGRVYYVGDATIPYTDWVDGFSVALRGRSAFRVPVSLLKMLGTIGDAVETLGVRAPLNSGRVFRMTTSSMVNLTPTLEVAGEPTISLDEGVERTVDWLHSQRLDRR